MCNATRTGVLWTGAFLLTGVVFAGVARGTAQTAETKPQSADVRALTPAERETRLNALRAGLKKRLSQLNSQLAKPNPDVTTRDMGYGALASLLVNDDPAQAQVLLTRLFATQNMDATAVDYGAFPWTPGSDIKDANSIEFGTQTLGPLLLHFGNRFSPEFRQEIAAHVRAAFTRLRRHKVPVSYTNIFLMRAVNLILMGEAIKDEQAAAEGRAFLDEWLAYTRRTGIHEFDSPTYYTVDLSCLGLGYRYAARAETRAQFAAALDFFWRDIAANFFPARGFLAGPHSRNYDFLTAEGGLDLYFYLEGWRDTPFVTAPDLEKVLLLETEDAAGYHVPQSISAFTRLPERTVVQTWDNKPGSDRVHYLTPEFSIGSASHNYGPQDKLLTVDLAPSNPSKSLPTIAIVPDVFDSPYGKFKTKDRSGHSKPTHLPLWPTTVQHKGLLLALLDLDPSKTAGPKSLKTNVLLPSQADAIVVNGQPFDATRENHQEVTLNGVVGIREGKAGVAIRVFHLDGANGQTPTLTLQTDKEGLHYHTARFTLTHYQGEAAAIPDTHVRVGLLIVAAPCENDRAFQRLLQSVKNAPITENLDGGVCKAKAQVENVTLEAEADLQTRLPLARRINGKDFAPGIFTLNSVDSR